MAGQIAAIRLVDHAVMVNLEQVVKRGLAPFALPILAHEIGHHVYVPGNLSDNARMIAAIKGVLFGLAAETAHLVANLYGDLLINDRLHRRGVDVAGVYRRLNESLPGKDVTQVWLVYTRTYEHLWQLAQGLLSPHGVTPEMNADAALVARLVRHYASDWLRGVRRFACILYPYLQADEEKRKSQTFVAAGLNDTRCAGRCRAGAEDCEAIPDGISAIDPAERGDDDEFDRSLDDPLDEVPVDKGDRPPQFRQRRTGPVAPSPNSAPTREGIGAPDRQFREPFEYAELLRALGLDLSDHEITMRYYRERALPYLIPFPSKKAQHATEPLAEGYTIWEPTDDPEDLDLLGSVVQSPRIIPGISTVQRVYGESSGTDPGRLPLDLDIYVDSSGSMPNPAVQVSYLALAGTILAMSALRAGARVQATLWSGAGQFESTNEFIRDERRLLRIITGFIAGSTAFPLHVLRDSYAARKSSDPAAHIVVISDEGVDTILSRDEQGIAGKDTCVSSLARARGGGTLVLNLRTSEWPPRQELEQIGFHIHAVSDWDQLVAFARAFVRRNYEELRL
jgi:hypothetical protein